MLKATRFYSSSEVYYSFRSCYGSGHMVDPSIDVTSPISLICRKLIYTITKSIRKRKECSIEYWYRELLENGFTHRLEFVSGVCSPQPFSTCGHSTRFLASSTKTKSPMSMCETIRNHAGPYEDLLSTIKHRKVKWYGLQGT